MSMTNASDTIELRDSQSNLICSITYRVAIEGEHIISDSLVAIGSIPSEKRWEQCNWLACNNVRFWHMADVIRTHRLCPLLRVKRTLLLAFQQTLFYEYTV